MEKVFLGTYTDDPTYPAPNKAKGIYQAYLDTEKQKIVDVRLIISTTNPTYLTTNNNGQIFSVSSHNRMGGISLFNQNYLETSTILEPGSPVCYVAFDSARNLIFAANYHKGELNTYRLHEETLEPLESLYFHEPVGPHKHQDASHIHYANRTIDNRLIICNLGTDRVHLYDVLSTGKLQLKTTWEAKPATGPRHLVCHGNGEYLYVVGELDCSVNVLKYEKQSGKLTTVSKTFTIPLDYTKFNSAAAIRISPDNRFLYVSNRGENSLVVYEITNAGETIQEIQRVYTTGDFPRDFSLNATRDYLLCGFQYSDYLNLFSVDKMTGLLKLVQDDCFVPECVCVCFS